MGLFVFNFWFIPYFQFWAKITDNMEMVQFLFELSENKNWKQSKTKENHKKHQSRKPIFGPMFWCKAFPLIYVQPIFSWPHSFIGWQKHELKSVGKWRVPTVPVWYPCAKLWHKSAKQFAFVAFVLSPAFSSCTWNMKFPEVLWQLVQK